MDSNFNAHGYRDNSLRAQMAIIAFLLLGLAAAVSSFLYFEEAKIWREANSTNEFAESRLDVLLNIQGILALFQFTLIVLTIVFFLMWFRRAYANLARIGIDYLDHKESMAVWAFFIPIMNLYRPYQIAKETATEMNSLMDKLSGGSVKKIPIWIISLWWGMFWFRNLLDNFALKAMNKDFTLSDKINAADMGCISDMFYVPATLVTVWMIHEFSKRESILFQKIQSPC